MHCFLYRIPLLWSTSVVAYIGIVMKVSRLTFFHLSRGGHCKMNWGAYKPSRAQNRNAFSVISRHVQGTSTWNIFYGRKGSIMSSFFAGNIIWDLDGSALSNHRIWFGDKKANKCNLLTVSVNWLIMSLKKDRTAFCSPCSNRVQNTSLNMCSCRLNDTFLNSHR